MLCGSEQLIVDWQRHLVPSSGWSTLWQAVARAGAEFVNR
jgi:hypothetical protein